jgi:hypothetical protein
MNADGNGNVKDEMGREGKEDEMNGLDWMMED